MTARLRIALRRRYLHVRIGQNLAAGPLVTNVCFGSLSGRARARALAQIETSAPFAEANAYLFAFFGFAASIAPATRPTISISGSSRRCA